MTRIEALVTLRAWQRAFEWDLARDHHDRARLIELVRRHSHDLFDQLQIVELAGAELLRRIAGTEEHELATDVAAAGTSIKAIVQQLVAGAMSQARHGAAPSLVGPIVTAAIARVTPALAVPIALDLAAPAAEIACEPDELEHLVVGMLLESAAAGRIDLLVRERMIDGAAWLELVRATPIVAPDVHELRIIEAIATRAGGEVSRSEIRGGEELVVALPCAT